MVGSFLWTRVKNHDAFSRSHSCGCSADGPSLRGRLLSDMAPRYAKLHSIVEHSFLNSTTTAFFSRSLILRVFFHIAPVLTPTTVLTPRGLSTRQTSLHGLPCLPSTRRWTSMRSPHLTGWRHEKVHQIIPCSEKWGLGRSPSGVRGRAPAGVRGGAPR